MKPIVTMAAAALALALAPAAVAQGPSDDDEPVPAATVTPGCERGPGTDADYAYCLDPCIRGGDDADYAYCVEAESGGTVPRPRRRAAVQPFAVQTLPMTGGEPWLIAACGAGFLLAGSGLRLRAR